MVSTKFKATWKTFLLSALGIIAFLIYLYFFRVDIPTIIATAQRIDFSIYFLAVAFTILDAFFFSLSWRTLLNFLSVKLSVAKSFLYVWYGVFMDIIIPAESISGEVSRVYLVTREQNETSGKAVASVVAQRLMGMGINIASLLVAMCLLLIRGQVGGIVLNITLFLAILSTIFLALLILLCIKETWTLRVIDAVIKLLGRVSRGGWKLTKIKEDVHKAARMFHDSIREFWHTPKTLFLSLFFYVLAWLLNLSVSYLVFKSVKFTIDWSVVIIISSIVAAVQSIPLGVPFEAGLPEITMTTLYITLIGWPPELPLEVRATICATATILIRILTVWLRFFIGFAAQQWLEIKTITATNVNSKAGKA